MRCTMDKYHYPLQLAGLALAAAVVVLTTLLGTRWAFLAMPPRDANAFSSALGVVALLGLWVISLCLYEVIRVGRAAKRSQKLEPQTQPTGNAGASSIGTTP